MVVGIVPCKSDKSEGDYTCIDEDGVRSQSGGDGDGIAFNKSTCIYTPAAPLASRCMDTQRSRVLKSGGGEPKGA